MKIELHLIKKREIARDTMAFFFDKPKDLEYRAGQFADLTLINPPETDGEGNTRTFSIITAPHENYIGVATRMRDTAFKRTLKNLEVGTKVKFDIPHGDFTLHSDEATPAIFIIGGIGITPVLSIITQATYTKTNHKLTLFYANKTLEDAPFIPELKQLATDNPNFTFIPVLTDESTTNTDFLQGRIDESLIKSNITNLQLPKYYLAGPEGMVKAMRKMLIGLDINEDSIRTEEFSGY